MSEKRSPILVTGAAGFIGSALCARLAADGRKVIGVDNLNDYYDVRLKYARLESLGITGADSLEEGQDRGSEKYPSFTFVKADITHREVMERLFEALKPEVAVNLAAQAGVRYSLKNPYSYVSNNVDGFLVMLECARNYPVKRFIYASSSSVYGKNSKVPFAETDIVDNPVSLYAATKKSNEMMARAYSSLYGIPAVGLRFFTVYGPWGRPDMAPMLFADAITEGRSINVFNGGDMKRDFTYIDDIVEGMVKVIDGSRPITIEEDILNIGHGSPMVLMEFISLLEEALGKRAEKNMMPMQKGDVPVTYADTSRLERLYGYRPTTELRDGIREFARWYKEENPIRPETR